jgi:hypothetical protein
MLDFAQPPQERVGHRSYPRLTFRGRSGLAVAMRFCRDGDTSLASLVRRVPESHVALVSRLSDHGEARTVACPCGTAQIVSDTLAPCGGGCRRYFISDASGVWTFRLPAQDE